MKIPFTIELYDTPNMDVAVSKAVPKAKELLQETTVDPGCYEVRFIDVQVQVNEYRGRIVYCYLFEVKL